DRSNGRFRMLYTVAGLPTNGQTTAYARFLSHPGGAAIQHGGTGCGAATLDFSGPALGPYAYKNALIGTRGTYVAGLSPNPTDLHFLIAAFGTTSVPIVHPLVAPGCTQLVPTNQIGVLPLQIGGFPAWPVSVPLSMVGVTLSFQDWVYDPLVDQLSATDRVTVDFVR
ncbi:MAG: hypothetical protein KDE27_26130, partial [Planctomycetes bacterium]|nr:hypothetical protein [Planctomycetota bacterium]